MFVLETENIMVISKRNTLKKKKVSWHTIFQSTISPHLTLYFAQQNLGDYDYYIIMNCKDIEIIFSHSNLECFTRHPLYFFFDS